MKQIITVTVALGALALALSGPVTAQTEPAQKAPQTEPAQKTPDTQQQPSSHAAHSDATQTQTTTQDTKEVAQQMQMMGKRMQEHGKRPALPS